MRLFSSRYEPLDPPAPLSGGCGASLSDPDLTHVRDVQHDADNILTSIKGHKQLAARRTAADLFTESMRDAWRGPDPR